MRIASIYFDDMVLVPGAKDMGGGLPRDVVRESSFHAADGWTIEEVSPGRFTLWTEGMAAPFWVGGYGYGFLAAAPPEGPSVKKGKR